MSYEEYQLIRMALFALLCVGDNINCIYTSLSKSWDAQGNELIPCESNTIKHYTVTKVSDGFTMKVNRAGNEHVQYIENVFAYEGELYIWNSCDFPGLNHEKRLEKVIEILKSENVYNDPRHG